MAPMCHERTVGLKRWSPDLYEMCHECLHSFCGMLCHWSSVQCHASKVGSVDASVPLLGGCALIMHKSHAQDWQSSCPTLVASEAPKGVCSRLCAGSALCVYIDVQPVHTHQVTAPRCLPRCLVLSAAESISFRPVLSFQGATT